MSLSQQISFNISQVAKQKFLQKTKEEGVSQKAILTACINAYLKGKISLSIDIHSVDNLEIYDISEFPNDIQNQMSNISKLH
jgi:hypothetical protein